MKGRKSAYFKKQNLLKMINGNYNSPDLNIIKVSAVIITYNEAVNLKRTLSQLYWCDEIVIVDSYSNDDTLSVCRDYKCKIVQRYFEGYGKQKRFGVSQALNEWILFIDADEYLTQELVTEIKKELKNSVNYSGYKIPMNLVFRGKEFRFGKESNRYFIRLFKKKDTEISSDKVHEKIIVNGKCKKLKNKILHYSYNNIHQCINKLNCYSTIGAEMENEKGKRKHQILIYIAIPYYFVRYYLIDRNFLNGVNGFYWSFYSTVYHFSKYVKMKDLDARN